MGSYDFEASSVGARLLAVPAQFASQDKGKILELHALAGIDRDDNIDVFDLIAFLRSFAAPWADCRS